MLDIVYDEGLDHSFIERLQNLEHLRIDPVTFEPISDEMFERIISISKKYPIIASN